jgi:hypothetical protein
MYSFVKDRKNFQKYARNVNTGLTFRQILILYNYLVYFFS